MKIIKIFAMIIIIFTLFALNSCTILVERWAIEWDNVKGAVAPQLTISNQTNETLSTMKYYVGDKPPADWSKGSSLGVTLFVGSSATFTIGTSGSGATITIPAGGNNTIWIKVAADAMGQSQLFAQDGFLYESADDKWQATIYKEK